MNKEDMVYVLSNTNFINWVMKKLGEHYYIDDKNSVLNENDIFYAKKLKTLFELVSEYAKDNGIEATKSNHNNLYYVEYNGKVFFAYEGVRSYGCFNNELEKKDIPYCISLEDVRRCKIEEILQTDNGIFDNLKNEIIKLNNKGVSLEFIGQITSRLLYEINKEKGFTKKK